MSKENTQISQKVPVFHGHHLPETATVVGYAALIDHFSLPMPLPALLFGISEQRRTSRKGVWCILPNSYLPEDTLYRHLVFALKYEGVNLLFFAKLIEKLSQAEIVQVIQEQPTGQYSRRIWFIYEWITGGKLPLPDLKIKQAVTLIDPKLQYAVEGTSSPRHRIINNLPGERNFCPTIRRTAALDKFLSSNLADRTGHLIQGMSKDILQRTSVFLLLKDSKASFTIEGEGGKDKRAARWGQAIGQSGQTKLSKEELLRLQHLVIESNRFTTLGFRDEGGFVGEHDRLTGEPIPEHISAKWQDLDELLEAWIKTNDKLQESTMDPVLVAAILAFGFVIIHPFSDGNGRIHRYLIHHILAKMDFSKQGIIFPVSAAMLDRIIEYSNVLSTHSKPLLEYIEWKETEDHNVEVLNETLDYYRFYDATNQAEFLYSCVEETIDRIIPEEIDYLTRYDEFKSFLDNRFEMPDKMVAMAIRFLRQNDGTFSKGARTKEFASLTQSEVNEIELHFQLTFNPETQ